MTRFLKKISIGFCLLIACFVAGVFFVGCGVDYSKIRLTPNVNTIEIEVGEIAEITVKIDGYQKGFSNSANIECSQNAILNISDKRFEEDEIKFLITGKAGGTGKITVTTFEAKKSCQIEVKVRQYSTTMTSANKTMYVSNGTKFVPDADYFQFDSNTTIKDLDYYYFKSDVELNYEYKLSRIFDDGDSTKAIFTKGSNEEDNALVDLTKFDEAELLSDGSVDDGKIEIKLDGERKKLIDKVGRFNILSVYTHSISNSSIYPDIVYCIDEVLVLPKIEVEVLGGYMDLNPLSANYGYVKEFKTINPQEPILIVPNDKEREKVQYVLKVVVDSAEAGSALNFEKYQSNQNVVIDFDDYVERDLGEGAREEGGKYVKYFKVSQNAQVYSTTTLTLNLFYDVAKDFEDENVNLSLKYDFVTKIAPTDITVNGSTTMDRLRLYNFYKYPDFGWVEMDIDVISNFGASPNFTGIYFQLVGDSLANENVDIMHNGIAVKFVGKDVKMEDVTADYMYDATDLLQPFYIRGKYGTTNVSSREFNICLKSEVLAQPLSMNVKYSIVQGATEVLADANYGDKRTYYVDYEKENVDFSSQIYANHEFQFFTYRHIGGIDVVELNANDTAYIKDDKTDPRNPRYYLNMNLTTKYEGTGIYIVYLDNGMPIELTFNVYKTLKESTTIFSLSSENNQAVTEFSTSKSNTALTYNDNILIEVLNDSDRYAIRYGSEAYLKIDANTSEIPVFTTNANTVVGYSYTNSLHKLLTYKNGQQIFNIEVNGDTYEDFRRIAKTIKYNVTVVSYSLVDEFYLKNGEGYAIDNKIYYGTKLDYNADARTVKFNAEVNNKDSYGFYKYYFDFSENEIANMFENYFVEETSTDVPRQFGDSNSTYCKTRLVYDTYSKDMIYFESLINNSNGEKVLSTNVTLKVTITCEGVTKYGVVYIPNALMFNPGNETQVKVVDGKTYQIKFDYVYKIGAWAEFDIRDFTLKVVTNVDPVDTLYLRAGLRQRKLPKRYEAEINICEYQFVEGISLSTNISKLNFTNAQLKHMIGVYTYPTSSTSKEVRVEFIRSSGNKYSDMLSFKIDDSSKESGIFNIELSCEYFYQTFKARTGYDIIEENCDLSGKIYIYPVEWGDSYSAIDSEYQPICIDVQYRNGSRANPYLLETVEDLQEINKNEITLKSHYEINSPIDMSGVQNFVPIGILLGNDGRYKVVGFSGTIIGTGSQSLISNVNITNDNFYKVVDGKAYAGLFAQIEAYNYASASPESSGKLYTIENVAVSGRVNITNNEVAYVGLLSAINKGRLSNVTSKIHVSNINANNDLFFGSLLGINLGEVYQDYTKFDKACYSNYTLVDDSTANIVYKDNFGIDFVSRQNREYYNMSSKNLSYFEGIVSIKAGTTANVVAGGVVGANSGVVEALKSPNLKNYGYAGYTSYTLFDVSGVVGTNRKVAVGGVIGAHSYGEGGLVPFGSTTYSAKVGSENVDALGESERFDEMIVGGEISTEKLDASAGFDAVGGIVGYADSLNRQMLFIQNTVSRVFIRGHKYVASICGYERTSDGTVYGNSARLQFVANKIQAVDNGADSVYCSNVIKYEKLTGDWSTEPETSKARLYTLGSYYEGTRSYVGDDSIVESYVDLGRENLRKEAVKLDDEPTKSVDIVDLYNIVENGKYGDYIVLLKNQKVGGRDVDVVYDSLSYNHKEVGIEFDESYKDFRMTKVGSDDVKTNVFFTFFFNIEGFVAGEISKNDDLFSQTMASINSVNPNSNIYPFKMTSNDISISASSSTRLSVDSNGGLVIKNTGLEEIRLTSVLNTTKSQIIYLYIVDYFNRKIDTSIYYTSASTDGVKIINDSKVTVYGNSSTSISVVPDYKFDGETEGKVIDGNAVVISSRGVLRFENVDYTLAKNSQISSDVELNYNLIQATDGEGNPLFDDKGNPILVRETDADGNPVLAEDYFSMTQVNKQSIFFFKQKVSAVGGDSDKYTLIPVLRVTVETGGKTIEYFYLLTGAQVTIDVIYKETATAIRPVYNYFAIQSNDYFKDSIEITSLNDKEHLFYEIFDKNGVLVQSRIPKYLSNIDEANDADYYKATSDDLFVFDITGSNNKFDYTFKLNKESDRFKNRKSEDIYGNYVIHLYANELKSGVTNTIQLLLEEAELNYIDISNYSDFKEIVVQDKIVVPSQRGVLEIALDPIDAQIQTIEISNNEKNYLDGANIATFVFVYEKNESGSLSYVLDPNFVTNKDGAIKFSYAELLSHYEELSLDWTGKFYVAYYMPATNVENGVEVAFDVTAVYGDGEEMKTTIDLVTRLGSYARLSFDDKEEFAGYYYVARGLSYEMSLDYYGFNEDQITVSTSNSDYATLTKTNSGKYRLDITTEPLNYQNDIGYLITIDTVGTKIVDDAEVTVKDTINIYVMEFVLNYAYDGTFKDIVKGMQNGEISVAVGNPYDLEFAIRDFLEYNETVSSVNEEVDAFVKDMTEKLIWKVYYNGEEYVLAKGKSYWTDFYRINDLTVTPLKICSAKSGIYYFSADASYKMYNGVYRYDDVSMDKNRIYTEFAFEVHNQSTEESPNPIENYEQLLNMEDNQWYILLNDITLPNEYYSSANGIENFKPLTAKIAGLDGNGYKIFMGGTYNFSDVSNVGLFESVSSGAVIKNLTISLTSDTVFKTNQDSFNISLITASNDGNISNCVTESDGYTLSVVCSQVPSSAYVSAFVGNNQGYITNSRSKVNMIANVNLSGFVSNNSGHIASSAFVGSSLRNETNTGREMTAGFVIENTGKIYTSYVSGTPKSGHTFYDEKDNSITSNNTLAGFVFNNLGEVKDCYTNIQLRKSGAYASGFVILNDTGKIENCISWSTLTNYLSSGYGFAYSNTLTDGYIKNCFYLSDNDYNNDGLSSTDDFVNVSIGEIKNNENTQITALRLCQFGKYYENSRGEISGNPASGYSEKNALDTYFKSFSVTNGTDINAVWFFNDNSAKLFNGNEFNTNRIELVSPNIIASSRRQLDRIEEVTDSETGATYMRYLYVFKAGTPALGSRFNPILISSAKEFETYINQENNESNFNYSYYRLISDIDYGDYAYNNSTYKTKLRGYFEGNFMTISGISLISSEGLTSAGLFAEVEKVSSRSDSVGAVLNLNIAPVVVSFSNADTVGAVVGRLKNGTVANVDLQINATNETNIVVGKNISGGVVGVALGNSVIKNVHSDFGAKARNQNPADLVSNNFSDEDSSFATYSFAGSVVGVLGGESTLYGVETDNTISVLGGKAGFLIGLVDTRASAESLKLQNHNSNILNAYTYGGLVVGQVNGKLSDVEVVADTSGESFKNVRLVPYIADAIGGVVGLVNGGILENIKTNQSIETSSMGSSDGIESLGGVIGVVAEKQASIKNVCVDDVKLVGYKYVGLVVGMSTGVCSVEDVSAKNTKASIYGRKADKSAIGGVIGRISDRGRLTLTSSSSVENKILKNEKIAIYKSGLYSGNVQAKYIVDNFNPDESFVGWANRFDKTDDELANENFGKKYVELDATEKATVDELIKMRTFINSDANAIDMIDSEEKTVDNIIDLQIDIDVAIYSDQHACYVGGIIGLSTSLFDSEVRYTSSSVTGQVVVKNMANQTSGTGNVKVAQDPDSGNLETTKTVSETDKMLLEFVKYSTINPTYLSTPKYYCDLTFSTQNGTMNNTFFVTMYGTEKQFA